MATKEKSGFSIKGIGAGVKRTYRDMRGEMKKVVWPTKKQAINNTMVVFAFMLLMAIVIGLVDTSLTAVLNLFFRSVV